MKRGDKIIACASAAVIAASLAVFVYRGFSSPKTDAAAQITQDGKVVCVVPLNGASREIRIGEKEEFNIIKIGDGSAQVVSSDCAGYDCIKAGKISLVQSTVICLPHRLLIKIISEGKNIRSDVDDVSW